MTWSCRNGRLGGRAFLRSISGRKRAPRTAREEVRKRDRLTWASAPPGVERRAVPPPRPRETARTQRGQAASWGSRLEEGTRGGGARLCKDPGTEVRPLWDPESGSSGGLWTEEGSGGEGRARGNRGSMWVWPLHACGADGSRGTAGKPEQDQGKAGSVLLSLVTRPHPHRHTGNVSHASLCTHHLSQCQTVCVF